MVSIGLEIAFIDRSKHVDLKVSMDYKYSSSLNTNNKLSGP